MNTSNTKGEFDLDQFKPNSDPSEEQLALFLKVSAERKGLESRVRSLKKTEDLLAEHFVNFLNRKDKKSATRLGYVLSLIPAKAKYPKWKEALLALCGGDAVKKVEDDTPLGTSLVVIKS